MQIVNVLFVVYHLILCYFKSKLIYTVSGKKRVYSILCVTLPNLKIFS